MTLLQLVDALNTKGIGLQARDGKLVVTAPKGAVTPQIRSELVARKPELIAFFSDNDQPDIGLKVFLDLLDYRDKPFPPFESLPSAADLEAAKHA